MERLNQLPCPVLVTDNSGRILHANACMTKLVGDVSPQQTMETLFPRSSQIFLQTHVWPTLFRDGSVCEIYLHIHDADKARVPVLFNCEKSIVDGVEHYYWVFFVALERSRFEAELLQARNHSNHLAANLTRANAALEAVQQQMLDRAQKLELANFELARLSYSDPLTGLANRRALDNTVTDWQTGPASARMASLLLVDVDFFKTVNDQHGHDEGDRVLVILANKLELSLREEDLAVRYGGEEFALWLPATDHEGAERIAQRVHAHVRDILVSGQPVTVSIGAASVCDIAGPELMHRLMERADKALYRAKATGRNRTVHYNTAQETTSILYSPLTKRQRS
ncbi:MAG: sensor domain-containing diguanylate cyclase [Thiobacillus sp.]|nr:sensor domain-containing diguanylate cyclase [Thiobacillus sp.]